MAKRLEHDHADGARTMADPDLWAMYDRGQDEWRAAVSEEAAQREANEINTWWANRKSRSPHDPMLWCIPDLWPFSAEEHAKDLAREMPMQARINAAIAGRRADMRSDEILVWSDDGRLMPAQNQENVTPGQKIVREFVGEWAFRVCTSRQLIDLAARIDAALDAASHEADAAVPRG